MAGGWLQISVPPWSIWPRCPRFQVLHSCTPDTLVIQRPRGGRLDRRNRPVALNTRSTRVASIRTVTFQVTYGLPVSGNIHYLRAIRLQIDPYCL